MDNWTVGETAYKNGYDKGFVTGYKLLLWNF